MGKVGFEIVKRRQSLEAGSATNEIEETTRASKDKTNLRPRKERHFVPVYRTPDVQEQRNKLPIIKEEQLKNTPPKTRTVLTRPGPQARRIFRLKLMNINMVSLTDNDI